MKKRKINLQSLLAPVVLVLLYTFFSFTGRNFFGVQGLKQILQSCYYTGYMAFGVTFVIITGGIDLSLGTNMMCSALLGGVAFSMWGWPMALSLVFAVLVGLFFGTMNGLMIAKLKLPPFIATLGTQMITMGTGSIISRVQTMNYPTAPGANNPAPWFRSLFYITDSGFPTGVVWLLGAFIICWVLLNKTRFGRYVFAIGSNEEAARLSGVKVDKYKIMAYALCGLLAGMAGIFYGAAYTTVLPGKGNGEEMNGIAAVVIGGTSMAGGSGSLFGTLLGVLVMATLKKGLASVGLQAHWQTFFTGFVVIGAVLLDNVLNSAALKSAKKE